MNVQSVTFGLRVAPKIQVFGASHLKAAVPAATDTGEVVVTVQTKSGSTSEKAFTYTQPQ